MMPRNILLPAAFAAAVGIPMIALRTDLNGGAATNSATANRAAVAASEVELFGAGESMFPPIRGLNEVLRFDVYPDWVKSRWPRVSTAPSADGLQGMRVALVTGSNPWDVCGSLTYYFDDQKQLQRISLVGDTGDASQIVKYLVDQFQFQVHATESAGLLTATKRRRTYGVLKLENPAVIVASEPNHQVRLVLELNNPAGNTTLSEPMAAVARLSRD